jgi:hypothetical protein
MKKMSDNESPYNKYKVEVILDEKQTHATWVVKDTKKDEMIRRGTWFMVELRNSEESKKTIRTLQEEGISYLISYVTLLETLDEMNSVPTENLVASHNLRKFKEPTEKKKKVNTKNTASYTQQIKAGPHTGISANLGAIAGPDIGLDSNAAIKEIREMFEKEMQEQQKAAVEQRYQKMKKVMENCK